MKKTAEYQFAEVMLGIIRAHLRKLPEAERDPWLQGFLADLGKLAERRRNDEAEDRTRKEGG